MTNVIEFSDLADCDEKFLAPPNFIHVILLCKLVCNFLSEGKSKPTLRMKFVNIACAALQRAANIFHVWGNKPKVPSCLQQVIDIYV